MILQYLADMQHFEVFVAFQFAKLHEAAWAFGDDDVGAGGFEVFVFVGEHFTGGRREVDLEGACAATAHGGVVSWQVGDGFSEQGLWFFVNALAAVEVAGGVVGDAQVFMWCWFVANGVEVFAEPHDFLTEGSRFIAHGKVVGKKFAVFFEHGAAAAAVGDDEVVVFESFNVALGHFFGKRNHAVGLLWQSAAVDVWHINVVAGLFNKGDGGIAGVFEKELHGTAFEVSDAFDVAEVNGAFGCWFGEYCWATVLHGSRRCVIGRQQAAGETRKLQRLSGADERPAQGFQRAVGHETADKTVFW